MRPRVGAQRPQHRSKKPNQRSPRGAKEPRIPSLCCISAVVPASGQPQYGTDSIECVAMCVKRTAKLFATSTLPKSASSARCTYDLSYRRRPSPSTQRPPRALSERLGDLVSQASAAQEKDDPERVSVLLLEALKLAPVRCQPYHEVQRSSCALAVSSVLVHLR